MKRYIYFFRCVNFTDGNVFTFAEMENRMLKKHAFTKI